MKIEQQQEPLSFLRMFRRSMVIHSGSREVEVKRADRCALYRVSFLERGGLGYTFAVEVPLLLPHHYIHRASHRRH